MLDGHVDAKDDSDAVTLYKKVKQRIKAPWANSLIVKVYGGWWDIISCE